MKPFKYRAIRKDNGQWAYGYFVPSTKNQDVIIEDKTYEIHKVHKESLCISPDGKLYTGDWVGHTNNFEAWFATLVYQEQEGRFAFHDEDAHEYFGMSESWWTEWGEMEPNLEYFKKDTSMEEELKKVIEKFHEIVEELNGKK